MAHLFWDGRVLHPFLGEDVEEAICHLHVVDIAATRTNYVIIAIQNSAAIITVQC